MEGGQKGLNNNFGYNNKGSKMEQQLKQNYEFFIETDLNEYKGEWVAICANKVVAHGKDVKMVFRESQEKCPGKKPLLSKIPAEATMIF